MERRVEGSIRMRTTLACLAAALSLSCASHSDKTLEARNALDARNPKQALALYNEQLEVDSAKDLPKDMKGDASLFVLDRAMILQQLENFELSSRDLEAADKQVELLDFSRSAVDDIGKYLFSDDSGPYKAPPYEKLMINTMNMVNYLVRGDLAGARIEARRFAVMQKYFKEHEDPGVALLGPGSYLAGFVFEKSGQPQEALLYYDEALAYGDYQSLYEPIRRLAKQASHRSPRIQKILDAAPAARPTSEGDATTVFANMLAAPPDAPASGALPPAPDSAPSEPPAEPAPAAAALEPTTQREEAPAEVFAIVSFGRVPAKIARRVPIGLALTYASGFISPYDRDRANRLALQGLVTWINFPELGKPRGEWGNPGFALDRDWQQLEGAIAIDQEARRAFERAQGAIVASAITRMLTRVVAGEGVKRASGDGVGGLLLSLATQATLTAADTPDTRSWSTLPARMAFGRVTLTPGAHWVTLEVRGERKRVQVNVPKSGWSVVNLTVLH
jgi:uncharacterized protein